MAKIVDDRGPEQSGWPIVVGTDAWMSGWGGAEGGASYAGWAAPPEELDRAERWVRNRGDMKRVRVVGPDYRPGPNCAHLHIYVWGGSKG